MQHRERDVFLRFVTKFDCKFGSEESAWRTSNIDSFKNAQIKFVRHRMESDQQTSLRVIESVSKDRDFALVRKHKMSAPASRNQNKMYSLPGRLRD